MVRFVHKCWKRYGVYADLYYSQDIDRFRIWWGKPHVTRRATLICEFWRKKWTETPKKWVRIG